MIFMGPVYRPEQEEELIAMSGASISNAASTFQWSIIKGLSHVTDKNVSVINALPVGTWPRFFSKLILKSGDWSYNGKPCHEVGCLNLPFIKQFCRYKNTDRYLKNYCKDEKEIIISTAYMPFLKAAYRLPKDVSVTAIITDIPEFYDMRRVSKLRKLLRKINNGFVYKYLSRVDNFVLLTEEMKNPLHVGDRPYVVIEGIYSSELEKETNEKKREKAILYTGRLNYRYGIENLLKAFEKIQDADAELWLCGAGEMENDIKLAAEKDKRIKFLGYQTHAQVLSLQRKAAVLVNPRTNDGEYTKYSFPSKTMEYMASGAAVVMYKLDGIPNEYDEHLFYAEKNTPDSLKEKLEEVLSMGECERAEKGRRARDFILSEKNSDIQSAKIVDMIKKNKAK